MARTKIDPAISRKAYAIAEKALKTEHAAEFAALIDEAYSSLGAESPRQRRERVAAEVAKAKAEKAAARSVKAQEKIAAARALLESAGLMVLEVPGAVDPEPVADEDPMSVFSKV
jgi:hypothetical protein